MPARRGTEPLRSGKLEALFLEEPTAGGAPDGEPVVRDAARRGCTRSPTSAARRRPRLRDAAIGTDHRLRPARGGRRAQPRRVASPRSWPERARLASAQRVARAAVRTAEPHGSGKRARTTSTSPTRGSARRGRWTSLAEDAWDWYRSSPLVRVLELGRDSRALVQVPGKPEEPVRLVGWRAERAGLRPARLLLAALAGSREREGAGTVRFQPWASPAGERRLRRACRLLGFVTAPRPDDALGARAATPRSRAPRPSCPRLCSRSGSEERALGSIARS